MANRSGNRDSAEIYAIYLFFDSEFRDEYASIADCLGETSLFEKPYPPFKLEKGDVLLTVDDRDVRHEPRAIIKQFLEDLQWKLKACPPQNKIPLLKLSYVKAKDFNPERHLNRDKVRIEYISCTWQKHYISITLSSLQPPSITSHDGFCTRCTPPIWKESISRKPASTFRGHPHKQHCLTQDVSCLDTIHLTPKMVLNYFFAELSFPQGSARQPTKTRQLPL